MNNKGDCTDAQADLRICCLHMGKIGFLMAWLIYKNIRVFNGCEARQVMRSSYPSDGIFNLHRRTTMDSFSCVLFLQQLQFDLNMCCSINFKLK